MRLFVQSPEKAIKANQLLIAAQHQSKPTPRSATTEAENEHGNLNCQELFKKNKPDNVFS